MLVVLWVLWLRLPSLPIVPRVAGCVLSVYKILMPFDMYQGGSMRSKHIVCVGDPFPYCLKYFVPCTRIETHSHFAFSIHMLPMSMWNDRPRKATTTKKTKQNKTVSAKVVQVEKLAFVSLLILFLLWFHRSTMPTISLCVLVGECALLLTISMEIAECLAMGRWIEINPLWLSFVEWKKLNSNEMVPFFIFYIFDNASLSGPHHMSLTRFLPSPSPTTRCVCFIHSNLLETLMCTHLNISIKCECVDALLAWVARRMRVPRTWMAYTSQRKCHSIPFHSLPSSLFLVAKYSGKTIAWKNPVPGRRGKVQTRSEEHFLFIYYYDSVLFFAYAT